jgi:hypothetical protein
MAVRRSRYVHAGSNVEVLLCGALYGRISMLAVPCWMLPEVESLKALGVLAETCRRSRALTLSEAINSVMYAVPTLYFLPSIAPLTTSYVLAQQRRRASTNSISLWYVPRSELRIRSLVRLVMTQ